MTLLAAERVKLLTTRSPWWCALLALGFTIGFAGLLTLADDDPLSVTVAQSQFGFMFGLLVVMVMAALAVTTEYRFSTIRVTFQAVPNRTAALLAKTTVVALLAAVIGEIAAFGSWGAANLLAPGADLALTTGAEWRMVAGSGLVFGLGAVLAIAVGVLLRQSAGAISLLLIWALLLESLVALIPRVGMDIQEWMPFMAVQRFLSEPRPEAPLGPWASLAYFGAVAIGLLVAALVVARKRDA